MNDEVNLAKETNHRQNSNFPIIVNWEITRKCNLNCLYCHIKLLKKEGELDFHTIVESLTRLKKLNRDIHIFFTGGEPLLRKDFIDIVKSAVKDFGFQCSLSTNGSLIDKSIAKSLIYLGLKRIIVSLDGDIATVHDFHSKTPGSFNKVINGINIIREIREDSNIDHPEICINTVVTKRNIDRLNKIVTLAINLGVERIKFSPILYNKDSKIYRDLGLQPADISSFLKIYNLDGNFPSLSFDNIPTWMERMCLLIKGEKQNPEVCYTGYEFFFINHMGYVYPCWQLSSDIFKYDNLEYIPPKTEFHIFSEFNEDRLIKYVREIMKNNFLGRCKTCCDFFNSFLLENRNVKYNSSDIYEK